MRKLITTGILFLILSLLFSNAVLAKEIGVQMLISNKLSSDFIVDNETKEPPLFPLELNWTLGTSQNTTVGNNTAFAVTATNISAEALENIFYIVEITKDGVPAKAGDFTWQATGGDILSGPVRYDEAGDYYFFGPDYGFTVPAETTITTDFEIAFHKAGTYTIKIFAVQLLIAE